ncbi:MAG: lamin tail domain-containing protein, partial [Candidatus Omnitrophica bacterium]|nr:lamin tail domain-containing protein [Candidatus Omnitrophota bacterium]
WHSHEGGFGSNIARADYIRDEFSRRLELAVGKVGSHGRYVHLYLNGMYWGVYILCERPDDGFAAEYFGGEKEEYDVITSGTRNINTTQIKAGDKNAWNQLMALARAGGFQDIQKYEAIQEYVDIDYLIDYMMVIYLAGNRDAPTVIGGGGNPWNFYSNHRRVPGEGFRFFCWDSEWTLEEPDRNVVTFHTQGYEDPSFLFLKLRSSPEFMIRVADRIQKHFFNDGGLTPQSTMAIYSELAETLDRAIVGESARWGDVKGGSPKTRDDNWLPEINRILTTYLPVRTDIVVNQLHDFGLYPDIPAPEFSQCGGLVQSNFQLGMTLQDDLQQDKIETPLIKIDHVWKYDQSGIDPGSSWKDSDFDDSNWPSGKALLYVEGSNLSAPKNTPLTIGRTTYYFRSEFDIPANFDLSEAQIELNVFVDDGMIVYINDKEVFRIGMPDGAVDYETFANRTVTNANYEGPFTLAADSIKAGKNVIAVEVHQINATSSDIVMGLTLNAYTPPPDEDDTPIYYTLDGSDPRLAGGEVNAESALSYNSPIGITDNVTIKARTHLNGQWSALTEADFIIDSAESDASNVLTNLRITELMYNPSGGEEFEFIELHNTHPTSVLYLNGLGFTNGVEFVFPNGTSIPAGDYLLVAPSPGSMEQEAFRDHYGLDESIALAGPYSGKFSNGGERITLSDLRTGLEIISFEYNDGRGWPVQADGAGHSLVPKPSAMTNQMEGSLEYGGHWRASYALGGSPGAEDPEPPASLVINEIVANPPSGESDWIELYNTANATIHLGDWYLSDDEDNLAQWPIPSFEMAANTWISFDQQNDFDNPPGSGFGLSKDGESLYLSYLPGLDGVDRVVDAISFKAQDGDRALGRFSDGYPYFAATSPDTREQANIPAPASIVIDELMYQPNPANAADETMYEYIEIYNASDKTRSFFNENGVYRIDGGVQFEFPANLTLDAGKRLLIVGFDPSDASLSSLFKKQYGASDIDLHILGPYSGKLSNQGERIALEKPKSIDALTQNINWGIVDEVIYFNADPWPAEAAGAGQALQRDDAHRPGSDPANWRAAEPTLGGQPTSVRSWMLY